jgi:hypothetical protein
MINFQNEMQNLANLYTFKKLYLFNNDWHKTCDLLRQLYVFLITSCKRFDSKNLSYEKVKKD